LRPIETRYLGHSNNIGDTVPCFLDTTLVGLGVIAEDLDLFTVDDNDINIGSRSQIVEDTRLNGLLNKRDSLFAL
jgi:hypothetical protein